jgi:hypothetical protein
MLIVGLGAALAREGRVSGKSGKGPGRSSVRVFGDAIAVTNRDSRARDAARRFEELGI